MSAASRLVRLLERHCFRPVPNPAGRPRFGGGRLWMAICPGCRDLTERTLGISEEPDEGIRLTCWNAECTPQDLMAALAALVRSER